MTRPQFHRNHIVSHNLPGRAGLVHPITSNRLISQVMNKFGSTKAPVIPRSVARRNEVYSAQGATGRSIRVREVD